MRRALARNINWFASTGKLFPLASSESMWKPCVDRLISLAAAVLFDISTPSDNIGWELDQVTRAECAPAIVFVARNSEIENALKYLRLRGVNAEIGVNVFAYDYEGMALVDAFTSRFAFLLTREHAA